MIPEDQHIAVCRIIGRAKLNKLRQSGRRYHRLVADVVVQDPELSAGFDLVNLIRFIAHQIVFPLSTAAGIDNDIDIVGNGRIGDLLKILRCHGIVGFQIGAAHVEHDRHRIVSVAKQRCELAARTADNRGIQATGIGIARPA